MKFFIVGLHGSGKQEIMSELEEDGFPVGKLFTNGDLNDDRYEFFNDQDIRTMFENNSYIFIKELGEKNNVYEGLSFYEFDNKKVFALTPDQFLTIPKKVFLEKDVCIIWLDNTTSQRKFRYVEERRDYNWRDEEEREKKYLSEFVNNIYNMSKTPTMYFFNEVPSRVVAILESMITHEDLIPIFTNKYKG